MNCQALRKIRENPLKLCRPGRTRTCNQTVMSRTVDGEDIDVWRKDQSLQAHLPQAETGTLFQAGSMNQRAVRKLRIANAREPHHKADFRRNFNAHRCAQLLKCSRETGAKRGTR